MKKILFVILLIGSSHALSAQNKASIAIGLNYSSVSSVNSTNPDGILGLNAGVGYKKYLGDLGWFIKPALFYSQEGWLHQRLNYINLPVIVGFDFAEDFNFDLGVQYGYLIGNLYELEDKADRSNYAFLIGFEFYPTPAFDIGLRFANGLTNIISDPTDLVIKDARTYSIQFYFGFNLYKKGEN